MSLSIFPNSDSIVTNYNPYWGQSTTVTHNGGTNINNATTITYSNLNYQGTLFDNSDISLYTTLEITFTSNSKGFLEKSGILKEIRSIYI